MDDQLDIRNTLMVSTNIELRAGVCLCIVKSNDLEAKEVVSVLNAGWNCDSLDTTIGNLLSR
jgi:hypothetical protein